MIKMLESSEDWSSWREVQSAGQIDVALGPVSIQSIGVRSRGIYTDVGYHDTREDQLQQFSGCNKVHVYSIISVK